MTKCFRGINSACWVMLLSVIAVLPGCGSGDSGPQRYHVSGTVKFAGEPLPYGTMQIDPDAGNSGPQAVVEIVDGKFDSHTGNGPGVIPGKVIVRIMGFSQKPEANPSSDEPTPALFEEYTQQLELPAKDSTQDFEVPPEATQQKRNEAPVQTGA